MKQEEISPEEIRKCKEDPVYFYNKYVRKAGEPELTKEQYERAVMITNSKWHVKARRGNFIYAYPLTIEDCFTKTKTT